MVALPILVISTFAIIVMVADALKKESTLLCTLLSCVGLVATIGTALFNINLNAFAFSNMIKTNGTAVLFDLIFCVSGIITILSSKKYFEKYNGIFDEFYTLILFAISGMMLISHANDLIVTFIGIEVMSICFYVLSGIIKNDVKGNESAVKYFLLGAFATGFLLYGIALIYGNFGSTNLTIIAANTEKYSILTVCGLALLVIGFGFKVGAVPFHNWIPDVYEGSPTVVAGFMSTAGKTAGLSGFISAMIVIGAKLQSDSLMNLIAIISAITMLTGNILAITQTNIKRMLAYSSIAHAGYALMGIVAGSTKGYDGILYYMCAYTFMQLGAFFVVGTLETKEGKFLNIADYNGLGKSNFALALIMALFMFSLLGLPPFAGFFGKYYLFTAAIEKGYTWLAIVGGIASILSAWFYLGLVVNMFFKPNENEHKESEYKFAYSKILLGVLAFGVLAIGFIPEVILSWTK